MVIYVHHPQNTSICYYFVVLFYLHKFNVLAM